MSKYLIYDIRPELKKATIKEDNNLRNAMLILKDSKEILDLPYDNFLNVLLSEIGSLVQHQYSTEEEQQTGRRHFLVVDAIYTLLEQGGLVETTTEDMWEDESWKEVPRDCV